SVLAAISERPPWIIGSHYPASIRTVFRALLWAPCLLGSFLVSRCISDWLGVQSHRDSSRHDGAVGLDFMGMIAALRSGNVDETGAGHATHSIRQQTAVEGQPFRVVHPGSDWQSRAIWQSSWRHQGGRFHARRAWHNCANFTRLR